MKLEILDTTLRDGAQGAGVSFNHDDKVNIIRQLDALGISYIEAGMITDDTTANFFREIGNVRLSVSKLCAFTSTIRPQSLPGENELLVYAAKAPVECVTVYGKSSVYHVSEVLRTTPDENLKIIRDSVSYLVAAGKKVIFDAEHFFDGFSDNAVYAMRVLDAAVKAGAERLVLCDTNGGMLPDVIGMTVKHVCSSFENVGIHCHNDLGMADACSVSAVLSGAVQIHGTVSGIGERCGNANINTLIPLLQLKLGFDCIGNNIKNLTPVVKSINESANLTFNESSPFVGGYAFTHKAGTHIDGISKTPRSFEHIDPESVGNLRNTVISELAGRAALIDKINSFIPDIEFDKDSPEILKAAEILKEKEADGYVYENAEASLALMIDEIFGRRISHFELRGFKIIVDDSDNGSDKTMMRNSAMIKISVGGNEEITAAEGNGPVNAMDAALRRALIRFYPVITKMKLTDYKVRVIDSSATASSVRVLIESTDGVSVWRTVGVSPDIINASWQALRDSVEYMLAHIAIDSNEQSL